MTEIVIPSSLEDRRKLREGVEEMSRALTRIEDEKSYIKDSVDALHDSTGVEKKYIRRMVTDYHKDQLEDKASEMDEYVDLYNTILGTQPSVIQEEEGEEDDE